MRTPRHRRRRRGGWGRLARAARAARRVARAPLRPRAAAAERLSSRRPADAAPTQHGAAQHGAGGSGGRSARSQKLAPLGSLPSVAPGPVSAPVTAQSQHSHSTVAAADDALRRARQVRGERDRDRPAKPAKPTTTGQTKRQLKPVPGASWPGLSAVSKRAEGGRGKASAASAGNRTVKRRPPSQHKGATVAKGLRD